jgi:hypothetical protein
MSKPKYNVGDKIQVRGVRQSDPLRTVVIDNVSTKNGEVTYGFMTPDTVDGEWCYESEVVRRVG